MAGKVIGNVNKAETVILEEPKDNKAALKEKDNKVQKKGELK